MSNRTKDIKMEAIRRLMVEYGMIGDHDFAIAVLDKMEAIDNMNAVADTRYLEKYAVAVPIDIAAIRDKWTHTPRTSWQDARLMYVMEQKERIYAGMMETLKKKELIEMRIEETDIIGTLYIYTKPTTDEKERT